jgi:hypothetical protein
LSSSHSSCITPFIDVIAKGTGGQIGISRSYCQGGWELLVDISTSWTSIFTIICFSLLSVQVPVSSPFLSSPLPPSFSTTSLSFIKSHSLLGISTHTIATMFSQVFAGAFVAVLVAQCSRFPPQIVVSKSQTDHHFCVQLLLRVAPGLTPSKKETTVTKFPRPTTSRRQSFLSKILHDAHLTVATKSQVPTRCCQPKHRPWMR